VAYSYAVQVFDAPGNQVKVPFPFLSRDHVNVKVDGVLLAQNAYVWLSDKLIQLAETYPGGTTTRVFRTTPVDAPIVIFEPTLLRAGDLAGDLNDNAMQLLFAAQEALDEAGIANDVSGSVLDYYEQMVAIYHAFQDIIANGVAFHVDLQAHILPAWPHIIQAFVAPFNAVMAAQNMANWTGFTTDGAHPSTAYVLKEYDPSTNSFGAALATLRFDENARVGTWEAGSAPLIKNKLYAVLWEKGHTSDLYGSVEFIPANL